jgi:hypothetical protein
MYNYYSELKRINDFKTRIDTEEKDRKLRDLRKSIINKFITSFNF